MKSSTYDKVEGTAKTAAGQIEKTTGKVIGNPRLQAEGAAKKAAGQTQKKVGELEKAFGN